MSKWIVHFVKPNRLKLDKCGPQDAKDVESFGVKNIIDKYGRNVFIIMFVFVISDLIWRTVNIFEKLEEVLLQLDSLNFKAAFNLLSSTSDKLEKP